MGKPYSKDQHQSGGTNVEITEHFEQISSLHDAHELKLWAIIILLLAHITLTIYKILKKKWKREGFQKANTLSMANINTA